MLEHKHLIISAQCNKLFTTEQEHIDWLNELVAFLDMEIFIPPMAKYLEDVGNTGWTAMCAIKTSSIVIHTWADVTPYRIELDIYSCKDFDLIKTLNKVKKDFDCVKIDYKFIDRDDRLRDIAGGFIKYE